MAEGNSPSQEKIVEMKKLERPRTFRDLRMVVGMFGFYSQFIPFFEAKIEPFRRLTRRKDLQDIMKERRRIKKDNSIIPPPE